MKSIMWAVLVTAGLGGAAWAQEHAKPLVNWQGMTLYTSNNDTGGTSHCDTGCTAQWPPHYAASSAQPAGDWTVVHRQDGTSQWAFRGKPLYTSTRDHKPGDTNGDGVDGVWRAARP